MVDRWRRESMSNRATPKAAISSSGMHRTRFPIHTTAILLEGGSTRPELVEAQGDRFAW
jgi:hypothetical protein